MEEIKYDVFISYSRKDYMDEQNNEIPGNEISKIMQALADAGISYWIDKEQIHYSENFASIISQNIQASRILLFLSTQKSNNSDWTANEIAIASVYKKLILPIRIDNSVYSDDIMLQIVSLEDIKYYENPEQRLEDMINIITDQLYIIKNKEKEEKQRAEKERERRIIEIQSLLEQLISEHNNQIDKKLSLNNQIEETENKYKHNFELLDQLKKEQNDLICLQKSNSKPSKKEQVKYDVYISYSQKDHLDELNNEIPNNEVTKIMVALDNAGITYEKGKRENSNEKLSKKVIKSIKDSKILLFLSTRNSNDTSDRASKEISVAKEVKKCILPLRVDNTEYSDEIMMRIINIHYIDYHVNPEQGRIDMINTIKTKLEEIKRNDLIQQEEEERRRQEEYNKRQEQINNIEKRMKLINDENEQLEKEKSKCKESIKGIDKTIKDNILRQNELKQELNTLKTGPTPPPIPIPNPDDNINIYLNRWNWGGIFFGCIWGLKNRLYHISLAIITLEVILLASSLSDIKFKLWFFAIIPFIGIRILFGSKGNQLAWKERKPEMSFDDFRSLQQKWCLAGIILLASIIIIVIIAASASS